ncbi:unnamed protein product [Periconia digitata]|uniref:Late sexual development protein n=1 Tax=Periconia digitata TaxID=1303443 RepID=A0A9W4UIG7_9PLEO|nr:unnamed protein product [Periconia digitata]
MRVSIIYSAALLASFTSALPTNSKRADFSDFSPDGKYFPLKNGFPTPCKDEILNIQKQAFGTLPNGPAPPALSPEGVTNLQLIALNELFEVAFFTELMYNISNKFDGYDTGYGHWYVMDTLNAIIAQEQEHLLNANGALMFFKQPAIQPCKYSFPVTDFQSAISLAAKFTDLVLGTLQDVNQIFAKNGDFDLVRTVSSVIGNEAEQEGVFRLIQNKRATSQPFLTTAGRDFAFSVLQSLAVPGSCPNVDVIKLQTFKPLNVLSTDIRAQDQNLKFSFASDAGVNVTDLSLVYINQQNLPVVTDLIDPKTDGGDLVFEAKFPFEEYIMNGLTIAAVVKGKGPFATVDDVAKVTGWGPGLIEVD